VRSAVPFRRRVLRSTMHPEFYINTTPTILPQKIEDLREAHTSTSIDCVSATSPPGAAIG
jgi:hypothetical protein